MCHPCHLYVWDEDMPLKLKLNDLITIKNIIYSLLKYSKSLIISIVNCSKMKMII